MIQVYPYRLIESIFGTFVADHFNEISIILLFIGMLVCMIRHSGFTWKSSSRQKDWMDQDVDVEDEQVTYPSNTGEWSPTGWYRASGSEQWEAPDYLKEEAKELWRWDEEKRIWINKEQERRRQRYEEFHKDRPPTFEEWKAQKLAEMQKPQEE